MRKITVAIMFGLALNVLSKRPIYADTYGLAPGDIYNEVQTKDALPATLQQSFHVGKVDTQGQLIIAAFYHKEKGLRYCSLADDYAFYVDFDRPESEGGKPIRFDLYSQSEKTIQSVKTLKEFQMLLEKLPQGARLIRYHYFRIYFGWNEGFDRGETISSIAKYCAENKLLFEPKRHVRLSIGKNDTEVTVKEYLRGKNPVLRNQPFSKPTKDAE